MTTSTLLYRLVLSIEPGTVQTGTGMVNPARKFKCTTASREIDLLLTKSKPCYYLSYPKLIWKSIITLREFAIFLIKK